MARTYKASGAIRSSATTPTLRELLFDLGFEATHDAEVSGVFDVNGAPDEFDLTRVPNAKVILVRTLSGGPFVLQVTSAAGVDQQIPFDDLFVLNLKGAATDAVTALKISGTGRVEFLAAGGT